MLYQSKRAEIGQHDLVTIYVIVIRPVLEYACPVWHTNLNKYLTESIETVQKRALTCIYPGNEYADILCLTNLPCLKDRCDSLCKTYFQNITETTHRLNYILPCQRCNKYDVRRFNKYPLPEIRTNTVGTVSLAVIYVKTTFYICKNFITNERYTTCRYHVALHFIALYFLCLYVLYIM